MAVESFCQYSGSRRLADAARTGEQIGVMQAVKFQSVTQSLRNYFLTGDFLKSLRPPFSCNHLIRHEAKL